MKISSRMLISVRTLVALATIVPAAASAAVGEPIFGTVQISGHYYGSSSNSLPGVTPQPEFRVVRHNSDQPFDTLAPDEVTITGTFLAEMEKGFVTGWDIGFEFIDPTNVRDRVHSDSNLWKGVPGISENFAFTVNPTTLSPSFQQKIIDACNAATTSDGEASIDFPVAIQVKAHRYRRGNTSANKRRDKVATGIVRSKVLCGTIAQVKQPPRPGSVDLRVKSLEDSCPQKTEVRAYIDYTEPTSATFRFRHNGNLSEAVTIKARKVSLAVHTFYRIERVKHYDLNPGSHDFRVEVNGGGKSDVARIKVGCGPFQASSMWLTLTEQNSMTCPKAVSVSVRINGNRPGTVLTKIRNSAGVVMAIESVKVKREGDAYVGRLTKQFSMSAIDTMLIAEDANDSASNSGWQPLQVACPTPLKGTLTFRDDSPRQCPRQASAALAIQTAGPGRVSWRLDCIGGRTWSGNVMAQQTGPSTFLATATNRLKITRNEHLSCALKTVEGARTQTLTLGGHQFQCITPSGVAGSGSITLAPPSTHDEPRNAIAMAPKATPGTSRKLNARRKLTVPGQPCTDGNDLGEQREITSKPRSSASSAVLSASVSHATGPCEPTAKRVVTPGTNGPSTPSMPTMQFRLKQ